MKILPQGFKIFRMNSIFIRLLLGFTGFILLSVLIVGTASYMISSKRLLEEVKKSNFLILKQARDSIDKEIARINDISLKIAVDKRVNKESYSPAGETSSNMDVHGETSAYLNLLKSTSDVYSNIWIRFDKSKNIVNAENIYAEDTFFNEVCVYKSNLDWQGLFNEYFAFSSIGRQEIYFNYASKPVITFVRSIPIGDIKPLGTIVLNMDEKVLSNVISSAETNNAILTYIIDSKSNVIFCNKNQYEYGGEDDVIKSVVDRYAPVTADKEGEINGVIGNKKYAIEFTSSNVNDWIYVTLIPNALITSKVDDIRNITVVIVALSLLIGLVLSYLLVKRVYNPVNNIVSYLSIINNNRRLDRDGGKSKDEFGFINSIINYVYNENESLKESFNKNIPMLKEKVLSDLLDGRISDIKFREVSENIGIQLPFNMFQVIVFEIDDYSSLGKNLQGKLNSDMINSIASVAAGVFMNNACVYPIEKGSDKIVVILNEEGNFQDTGLSYEFLDKVTAYFGENYGITFTIGLGKAYYGHEKCSMSFIEALFALKYKVVKGQNTIIHIDEIDNIPENTYRYPIETEKHIVNKLKSGDMESIRVILEDMFAQNLNAANASPEMVNNFFNALIGTLVRTVYEIQSSVGDVFAAGNDPYHEISSKNTIKEKKNYILFLFETVAAFVNRRKSNNNMRVYEKVIKFIEDNYQKELSLDNVSEAVGLSPSYLSLVFKEVSGMNFVEYVNTYRISKAKTMLQDITLTVSEISEKVGYTNSNTFIKVFKKYEGITPGHFRESNKS